LVSHLRKNGYEVTTEIVGGDVINAARRDNNIGPNLSGCHLAKADGYLIEGHVPADDIARMLETRPAIAGLSVPGMVPGSPGMSGAPQPYRVLAFNAEGNVTEVFARY
jgi:hypothetical protein